MTDRDKLQQLFQAALQDSTPEGKASLARAFPTRHTSAPETDVAPQHPVPVAAAPAPVAVAPVPQPFAAAPIGPAPAPFSPMPAAPASVGAAEFDPRKTVAPVALDATAAEELGALLDEQNARKKRRARRAALCTLAFFLTTTGGFSAWFVQNPERVQAFKDAMRDIRSVADVQSMVAKYDAALERIQVRSKQIDQASMAMGIDPTKTANEEDPYFEAEMKGMMGSDAKGKASKTVGQRNGMLKDKFGHMEKDHAPATNPKQSSEQVAKANAADGFDWKK